jgi:hypothetical protein
VKLAFRCFIYLLMLAVVTACAGLDSRLQNANTLALAHGFTRSLLDTGSFNIVTYQKIQRNNADITVYIEGDGYAFVDRVTVSTNPTPINAIGLKLAVTDKAENVVYIARPCMYLDLSNEPDCIADYWTTRRYAPAVIEAISKAIDAIMVASTATKIRLVGYSGGGTIATILAAERDDVLDLRTVAGNLDIAEFARYHKVTPLTGSLNPLDFATALVRVPQRHYVGTDDNIIVRSITESYLHKIRSVNPDLQCSFVEYLPGITHNKGWEKSWPTTDPAVITCK